MFVPGFISNLDLVWEEPSRARFFSRLASFSRLILFDKRGTGLSDRFSNVASLEERMDDVRAVMDAVGGHIWRVRGRRDEHAVCRYLPSSNASLGTLRDLWPLSPIWVLPPD